MLLPTLAIFTSRTSPATMPLGLLIVRFVPVVVAVVAVPRCAIAANTGMGMAVFTTTASTRARAKIEVSPSIGIASSMLRVFLEIVSIDLFILSS